MTDASATDEFALVSAEDTHGQAEWEKMAAAVLRKARKLKDTDADTEVWARLTSDSLAGIEIPPLGTPEMAADLPDTGVPGAAPFTRGRTAVRPDHGWDIRPSYGGADVRATNEAILVDLENGATSVWLTLTPGGLAAEDLPAALEGVLLDLAPVVLDSYADPVNAAQALVDLLAERGVTPAEGMNLGADPIAALVRGVVISTGSTTEGGSIQRSTSSTTEGGSIQSSTTEGGSTSEVIPTVARLAREAGTLGVVVDATAVHDLGSSEWLELGYSLAVGSAYLRILTEAGFGIDEALGLIEFRYAATDDQFVTIAKLRAARRLWDRVGEICQASPEFRGQRQHAVTSRPMMAKYDPWVNMLRTTVAAFAAGVGGADAVTVLPFDTALGLPDAFSRRIARNTSSLLISESHVAKVVDPAGGSYAVEKMTDDLAAAGWQGFMQIEDDGGIEAAMASGWLAEVAGEDRGARRAGIAGRRQPLTGVSEFPNLHEALPTRAPYPDGTAQVARNGADFEAMRDAPAAREVFLATMGSVAAHTARASFASNLFAAGGITVEASGATATTDDVLKAYAGQPVVCLAGPDAAYADWGSALIAALRGAGASWVIVMGKPAELEVDDFFAVGYNAVRFLIRTREKLA